MTSALDINLPDGILTFNLEKAIRTTQRLVDWHDKPNSSFHSYPILQNILPKSLVKGSKEHANYLFAVCASDSRMSSSYLYPGMARVFDSYYNETEKPLFNPETLLDFKSQQNLERYLSLNNFTLSPKIKHDWLLKNAQKILDLAPQGDLTKLIKEFDYDSKIAYEFVKNNFKGLGEGTGALLVKYMYESEIWNFDNPSEILLKVDIHKQRFPFALGFYDFEEPNFEDNLFRVGDFEVSILPRLQEMYSYLATKKSSNSEERLNFLTAVDETIWRIGASFCSEKKLSHCHKNCPVSDLCQGLPHVQNGQRGDKSNHREVKKLKELPMLDGFGFEKGSNSNKVPNSTTFIDYKTRKVHSVEGWKGMVLGVDTREDDEHICEKTNTSLQGEFDF